MPLSILDIRMSSFTLVFHSLADENWCTSRQNCQRRRNCELCVQSCFSPKLLLTDSRILYNRVYFITHTLATTAPTSIDKQ